MFRMALLLPSITRRLEDILLVKELNAKFFDNCITERLLHTAVSAPSASVEFDYERLELLGGLPDYLDPLGSELPSGDAYLKYLSSIYLFVTNPTLHEGALHMARQRIISNRSLLKNADRSGLPQYIQSKPFTSRMWRPPNFSIFRHPKPVIAGGETEKGMEMPAEVDIVMDDPEANGSFGEDTAIHDSNSQPITLIVHGNVSNDLSTETSAVVG